MSGIHKYLSLLLLLALIPVPGRSEVAALERTRSVRLDRGETLLLAHQQDSLLVVATNAAIRGYGISSGQVIWEHRYAVQDQAIGLPQFGSGIALYFTTRGRGKYPEGESGEVLLSAVDLRSGELLWSAYLPGYLPVGRFIDGGTIYLTCERVGKPLTLSQIAKRWNQPPENRSAAWILAIELDSGQLLWHAQSTYWPTWLGTIDDAVYFAEHKGSGRGQKTLLSKRDVTSGKDIWSATGGLDRTRYYDILSHPRGLALLSTGGDGTISHLLHPLTGELMGRLPSPMGFRLLRGDTLWSLGARETLRYTRILQLNATRWNSFTTAFESPIQPGLKLQSEEWYRTSEQAEKLRTEVDFWAVNVHSLPMRARQAFDMADASGRRTLLLPIMSDRAENVHLLDLEDRVVAVLHDHAGETRWLGIGLRDQREPLWQRQERTGQLPRLASTLYEGHVVAGVDTRLQLIDPDNGRAEPFGKSTGGQVVGLHPFSNRIAVASTHGLDFFAPVPQPEPEPVLADEPVVVQEPEPEPVLPVVAIQPPALPVAAPPEPKPVVPQEVWRVQLMYLSRTPLPRIEAMIPSIQSTLNLPVRIVPKGGAYLVQAGNFESPAAARAVLRRVRSAGYPDAFLVGPIRQNTE